LNKSFEFIGIIIIQNTTMDYVLRFEVEKKNTTNETYIYTSLTISKYMYIMNGSMINKITGCKWFLITFINHLTLLSRKFVSRNPCMHMFTVSRATYQLFSSIWIYIYMYMRVSTCICRWQNYLRNLPNISYAWEMPIIVLIIRLPINGIHMKEGHSAPSLPTANAID